MHTPPEKLSYFLHMVIALLLVTGWLGRVHTGEVFQWISVQLHL